ncbi:MAG: G5 domain-containing protein, partial [Clostridia bacterium]|nr:G5 domain-containing protein [Clostridia bacterium]
MVIAMAILVIVVSGQTVYVVRVDNHYELYRGLKSSPENVLHHMGIELGEFDETTVKDGEIISKIDVIRAWKISLQVDGETRTIHTTGQTVSEILKREHIELGAYDAVSPAPDNIPQDGGAVVVSRGSVEYVEETVTLPYKTVEVESDDYYVGTVIKSAKGQDGEAVRKYAMIYRDGELVSRELVSETVTTEAVDAYNIVGTHSAAQSSARLTMESTRVETPTTQPGSSGGSGSGKTGSSGGSGGSGSGKTGSSGGSGSGSG